MLQRLDTRSFALIAVRDGQKRAENRPEELPRTSLPSCRRYSPLTVQSILLLVIAKSQILTRGFAHLDLRIVSSSEALSREDILALAIKRTTASLGDEGIGPIVSVGDAVWDVWAARRLGLRFIGVGEGDRAARLLSEGSEGAPHVIPDYRDQRRFLDLLQTALPVI
jgi:hypothetical protein